MDERLYRLGTLVEPPLPGRARRAGLGDLGRMVDWYAAFAAEAGTATLDADVDALVRHRIARGELVLWEHEGRIVSFAAFSTPVAAMARIGPVYTPPEHRRRGYGAAVTHAAAVAARAAGATEVLLSRRPRQPHRQLDLPGPGLPPRRRPRQRPLRVTGGGPPAAGLRRQEAVSGRLSCRTSA